MKIVIFGLTITSAWGNGHATTFRALVKALARRGHHVVFIEKDVEWYRNHRDLPEPGFCEVLFYDEWRDSAASLLAHCADADAIVIGSYFPDAIAATDAILDAQHGPLFFYDIDTPITLTALRAAGKTAYLDASHIPQYDAYLSFSGGPSLHELESTFAARRAIAFYCSVDPHLYRPVTAAEAYRCDLSYLGTYAEDRQPKLMQYLNQSAALLPHQRFLVAGAMYPAHVAWQGNVAHLSHVAPPEHPAFYSSARFSLNLTRHDMVAAGYSPSVRLFEASACGAAMLSDTWDGLDTFLTPGEQILLPRDEHDVADILRNLPEAERLQIGQRARQRILDEHSSTHRAAQFEAIVSTLSTAPQTALQTNRDKDPASSQATARESTPLYTVQ